MTANMNPTNETDVTEQSEGDARGSHQRLVLRQWCVEKSIQWCGRPDDQTQTDEMIDQAAAIERYVTTGKHSHMLEMGLLQSVLQEAERHTRNVSQSKAKAVCDFIAERCDLPQNNY